MDTAIGGVLMAPSALALLVTQEFVYLLDVAMFGAIIFRRTAPVASFSALTLALVAQAVLRDTPQWGDVAFPIGLYAIAAYGPAWARWTGLGIGLCGAVVATGSWGYAESPSGNIYFAIVSLAAIVLFSWTLGDRMRTRRAYVAELENRAVRLERDAEQRAQIAAAAERARIAREMHDVVAHSLSVIVVQADGALFAARKKPQVAAETLGTISETGRASLAEMRRLIGLLRGDGTDSGERTPMPSGTDLPALIDQVTTSGLDVTLDVQGDLERVGSGTGLTVYRVVQEALTNTLKHAGPDVAAQVDVSVEVDCVVLRIEDDGRGIAVTDDGHGHGIAGMRERIAVHDGTIVAGPRPGGGFRVDARIPLSTTEGGQAG